MHDSKINPFKGAMSIIGYPESTEAKIACIRVLSVFGIIAPPPHLQEPIIAEGQEGASQAQQSYLQSPIDLDNASNILDRGIDGVFKESIKINSADEFIRSINNYLQTADHAGCPHNPAGKKLSWFQYLRGGGERQQAQVLDKPIQDNQKEIRGLLTTLGYINDWDSQPSEQFGNCNNIVVLGATQPAVRTRFRFLHNLLQEHKVSFPEGGKIIFATGSRDLWPEFQNYQGEGNDIIHEIIRNKYGGSFDGEDIEGVMNGIYATSCRGDGGSLADFRKSVVENFDNLLTEKNCDVQKRGGTWWPSEADMMELLFKDEFGEEYGCQSAFTDKDQGRRPNTRATLTKINAGGLLSSDSEGKDSEGGVNTTLFITTQPHGLAQYATIIDILGRLANIDIRIVACGGEAVNTSQALLAFVSSINDISNGITV